MTFSSCNKVIFIVNKYCDVVMLDYETKILKYQAQKYSSIINLDFLIKC